MRPDMIISDPLDSGYVAFRNGDATVLHILDYWYVSCGICIWAMLTMLPDFKDPTYLK